MEDKLEKLIKLSASILPLIAGAILMVIGSVLGFQMLNEPNTLSVLLGIMLLLICLVGCVTFILIAINYFKNKLWD